MKQTLFIILLYFITSISYARLHPLPQNIYFDDSSLTQSEINNVSENLKNCINLVDYISEKDTKNPLDRLIIEFSSTRKQDSMKFIFPKKGISKIIISFPFNNKLQLALIKTLILHNNHSKINKLNNKVLHWIATALYFKGNNDLDSQKYAYSYQYLKETRNNFIENIIDKPSYPQDGLAFDLYSELSYLSFLPFYNSKNRTKIISEFFKDNNISEDIRFKSTFGKFIENNMINYKELSPIDKRQEFFYNNVVAKVIREQEYCDVVWTVDRIHSLLIKKRYNGKTLKRISEFSSKKTIANHIKEDIAKLQPFAPYLFQKLLNKLEVILDTMPKDFQTQIILLERQFSNITKLSLEIEKRLKIQDDIVNRTQFNSKITQNFYNEDIQFEEYWKELYFRMNDAEEQYIEALQLNMEDEILK